MKLRVARKIAHTLFGHTDRDLRRLVGCRYRYGTVRRAKSVCRRRRLRWDRRLPYIPSESELHEQAEIRGVLLTDLAEHLGLRSREECEAKKEEFLAEMRRAAPARP